GRRFTAGPLPAEASVRGEAIQQPVAAGALQVGLAAAAVRSARGMRGVPRQHRRGVVEALAIVMADHRGALRAFGPVAAGAVVGAREGGTVRLRAGEDVVAVRRVAAAVDDLALLAEPGLLVGVVGAMQLGKVLGDHHALAVHPGAAADAILRVHGVGAPRAQVRPPRLPARANRLRKLLAMAVCACEPAEVSALAGAGAGDEE